MRNELEKGGGAGRAGGDRTGGEPGAGNPPQPVPRRVSCGIWVPKSELLLLILDGAVFLDALGLDFRFFAQPGLGFDGFWCDFCAKVTESCCRQLQCPLFGGCWLLPPVYLHIGKGFFAKTLCLARPAGSGGFIVLRSSRMGRFMPKC